MTTSFVARGTEIIKSAVSKDNLEEYESALNLYSRGIEFLMTGMKYEKNPRVIAAIRDKVNKYLERAENIKIILDKKQQSKQQNGKTQNNKKQESKEEMQTDENDEDRKKLQGMLSDVIVMSKPNVSWDDIGGLDVAKSLLQEAVILPIRFPHLFDDKITNRKVLNGILLYGPPGTGKSYLAKAVASCAKNSTFFSVSSADLVSKYVGESAKLVRELYKMARDNAPAIIFIDEIDSLVTKRTDNDQSSSRGIKTEFLVQMEGVGKNNSGVLTLGATNCPWDLDPAIRRRFGKRIYISLPDKNARKEMFKLNVCGGGGKKKKKNNNNNNNHSLTDEDFDFLANKTEGFSGSDIAGVVQDALMEPIRTMRSATHFKKMFNDKGDDYTLIACSPNDPNGIEMRLLDVSNKDENKVRCEKLKLSHFLRILKSAKSSVGNEDIKRHMEWTKQFGQEGS